MIGKNATCSLALEEETKRFFRVLVVRLLLFHKSVTSVSPKPAPWVFLRASNFCVFFSSFLVLLG